MRVKLQLVTATAGVALAIAPAQAQGQSDFVLGLGTEEPGAAALPMFDVRYRNASDPNGKPPAVTGALFRLPSGTRIDTAAVPRCTATDQELRARGAGACPPETRVGGGTLTAITGFGPPADPVTGDVTVFNGDGQLIEVVTAPGTDRVVGMDRLTVEGSNLRAHPPNTPGGPPDGRTAVKDIRLKVDRAGYATAPPDCPADGVWRYGASFEFADGSRAQVAHTLPCARRAGGGGAADRGARPSLSLRARPSRARVGRRTKFTFVVRSSSRRCTRGAKVRFASERARTDRRGRAAIVTTVSKRGPRPVNVSKRGCRTARGAVRIVR